MSKNQCIIIMTDTQRKDMVSIYNQEKDMHTPYLDQLAEGGIRFERAYTCQPVCGPARSALFTGTYPHTNGTFANSMAFNAHAKTIGQLLLDEDIVCGYIGKWHLDGGDYFGDGICPEGYEEKYWYDMRNYLDEMSDENRLKSRDFHTCFRDGGIEEKFTYAHKCTQKAKAFIEEYKDKDFLLILSYDEPHGPFLAPQKYFEPFKGIDIFKDDRRNIPLENLPEHIQVWAKSSHVDGGVGDQFGLAGCNSFVDYEIGRFMQSIDAWTPEALTIYTSDHGDALGGHGISNKGPAMYDEITNIPLIIRWKGHIQANQIDKHPVSHIDIVPTVLDYFDLEQECHLSGSSLLKRIKRHKASITEEECKAFIEFTRYEVDHDGFGGFQPIRCIVQGQFKLVINLMTTDELYNLDEDPMEQHNLINHEDHIEIRNHLHDQVLNWMNETRDPFRGYYWERRPWRKDAVEASWDYTGMTRQRYIRDGEVHQLDYNTGLKIKEYTRNK